MKVLMFGWEFPPHISGGLGTACFGLTHSLGKEEVDVLFVVPKLHGDETADRIELINASEVRLNPKDLHKSGISSPASSSKKESKSYTTSSGKTISVKEEKGFTYVEVPSGLSAYRSPGFEQHSEGIAHWNYNVGTDKSKIIVHPATKENSSAPSASVKGQNKNQEVSYSFSGAYGPDLLVEVERYAQVAAEIAKRFSFDVIHAHDWMTYPAGIAAKEVSGKPLVVHVHATEYDRSGDQVDTRVYDLEREGMQKADCVVTVSEWTRKIAITKYKVSEDKVKVVHNGIILKKREKIEFTSPLKQSPIVTFLGRITYQKGPLYFVDAAKKVLQEIPDARFIVAGSGDLLPTMIQRVAQAGMSSRFHFTGFLKGKDIEKIWSISNVYVMPSVSEPFGIAPLEAIQAGVPVIISKQSGVAEVMQHAISVDFWNTTALAEAVCSVLKYKSLYRTLKKNSKAEIKSVTWDKAAKTLNHLYHELTEQY
jgi:glycosyltransferase involved in cell wall biosynthesis